MRLPRNADNISAAREARFWTVRFEASHSPADSLKAEEAFRQLQDCSDLTPQDLLCWAELCQLMSDDSVEQALNLYAQIPDRDDLICRTARRRHAHLLIRLGRSTPELEAYLQELNQNGTEPEEWLELVCTFQESGRGDDALHWLNLARERFPAHLMVCYWGGVICQAQNRWQEALTYWEALLALDPDYTDAVYGCAECREQLGDYQAAFHLWDSLAKQTESDYPQKQARRCREQLDGAFV